MSNLVIVHAFHSACIGNMVMREHDFMEMLHYALHDITISYLSDRTSHYMITCVIIWLYKNFMYCIIQLKTVGVFGIESSNYIFLLGNLLKL